MWQEILEAAKSPWVIVGFIGQLLFTGRMLVQWIESERQKRSVVPVSFWWFSLLGTSMLLAYAVARRDPVYIVGQSFGFVVYSRNLVLLKRAGTAVIAPAAESANLVEASR